MEAQKNVQLLHLSQQILAEMPSKGVIWQVTLETYQRRTRVVEFCRRYEILVTVSGMLQCSGHIHFQPSCLKSFNRIGNVKL